MSKIIVQKEEELANIIEKNAETWMEYPLWLLEGPLGAGKTTFVKKLLHYLDPDFTNVRSPSFALMHTYKAAHHTIIHADFYRLEHADMDDFGFHELLGEKNTICIIEWPEKLSHIPDIPRIHFQYDMMPVKNGVSRELTVKLCQ